MKFYEKAYYYIIRRYKKSLLLGFISIASLLMGVLGITLLHALDDSLMNIGRQSKAKITVFMGEDEQYISEKQIAQLAAQDNIYFVNRNSEVVSRAERIEVSVGQDEKPIDAKVRLQGFDDFVLDGLFAQDITRLGAGTLPSEIGDLNIYESLAHQNKLKIGDEISFQSENGQKLTGTIRGIYTYIDPDMGNEEGATSTFRFENLIFAHPEFINQLKGEVAYNEAHFYVTDPRIIRESRQEFEQVISGSGFGIWTSDTLFRKMDGYLLQIKNTVRMIIGITGTGTVIIISLLLILWAKERKREVAILLSIGTSKLSIFMQRLLEGFFIYIATWLVVLLLGYLLTPYIGSIVTLAEVERVVPKMYFGDLIQVFLGGFVVLVVAVGGSCLSIMRLTPRNIFSSMD